MSTGRGQTAGNARNSMGSLTWPEQERRYQVLTRGLTVLLEHIVNKYRFVDGSLADSDRDKHEKLDNQLLGWYSCG